MIDAYARKFGGPEAAEQIVERLTTTTAEDRLEFHLDIAQRANTFDAHRLIDYAARHGRQGAMKERLLQAYFVDGLDVADHSVLAGLAADAGLDADDVRRFLASDEGRAELREELVQGLERGVTAVPTFVFENTWAVPGAQDADTMLRVLRTVAERITPAPPAAGVCDNDACAV